MPKTTDHDNNQNDLSGGEPTELAPTRAAEPEAPRNLVVDEFSRLLDPGPSTALQRINRKDLPRSLYRGELTLGDVVLQCHVLSNKKRVFSQADMVRAITGDAASNSNLRRYVRGIPGAPEWTPCVGSIETRPYRSVRRS